MPDYFVPIDTTTYSNYYRDLISRGVFNQFILGYEDNNRKELKSKYPDFKKYRENFKVTDHMLQELISYAAGEGLKLSPETADNTEVNKTGTNSESEYSNKDFQKSKPMISLLFKAYLARDLWTSSEFYQIYNHSDPIFEKAVKVLEQNGLYSEKLQALTQN